MLHIEDIDVVDGTPLLDIKPYVAEFDNRVVARAGWLSNVINAISEVRADERFR